MTFTDWLAILHPAIAVLVVFPLMGIVVYQAWYTRTRRLQTAAKQKSKIPPSAGLEHVRLGRWLTGAVVGVSLLALAYVLLVEKNNLLDPQAWAKKGGVMGFQLALLGLTTGSLVLLYGAAEKHWRAIFATLTGMGVAVLGFQEGVYRRDSEWAVSHFYYGLLACWLMIFSLAILPEIYRDRRWRTTHVIANLLALALFFGQGITGSRDLLEIPLSWQKPTVYQCDFQAKTCPGQPPAKL